MTNKPAGPKPSSSSASNVTTQASGNRDQMLSAEEEKAVRMSQGVRAPDDLQLEWLGQGHPDTLAKLREMERMAFEQSGRIDELRREVGVEASEPRNETRDKIVSKLNAEAGDAGAEANVTAGAEAKNKS